MSSERVGDLQSQHQFMFEQTPDEVVTGRPSGITAVALIFIAYAIVAAIYALLLASGRIAMSRGAWLVGGGFEIMGKWVFALYALINAVCALGLWRMQTWALRVASLLLLWGVFQVIPAISSATADVRIYAIAREGVQILWRVIALRYLWQESTRDSFRH